MRVSTENNVLTITGASVRSLKSQINKPFSQKWGLSQTPAYIRGFCSQSHEITVRLKSSAVSHFKPLFTTTNWKSSLKRIRDVITVILFVKRSFIY